MFGDEVENIVGVVIVRELVLYCGIFYFGVFMDDDFYYCCV